LPRKKQGGKSGVLDSLLVAALVGNIDVLKKDLEDCADVNQKIWNRYTPLRVAAKEGRGRIIEQLIAKRADVNAKNDDGEIQLDCSVDDFEFADIIRKYSGKAAKELKVEEK
jgi:ankyrin repeat protein